MCGIFGFIGFENCFTYGINGLKQLQNRGYDSAGCCCIKENKLIIKKYASTHNIDSINILEKDYNYFEHCENGIFHTRWATHGAKTDNNAHPHIDNKKNIALVHNGIIENYYELKQKLETNYNIHFYSETDTEVIVNLLSIYYDDSIDKNGKKHMKKAIIKTIDELKGTWGLVIICKDKPDKIYCIRYSSSLLIGFNDSYTNAIITSEQAGFNSYVKNYICLNNNDLAVIKKQNNKINYKNINNYELKTITIQNNELSPEPFQHWTIKEIYEQYEASIRAIYKRTHNNNILLDNFIPYIDKLKNIDHLLLLGCGTSFNAGQYSMSFFKDLCNFTTVQTFDGSEFIKNDIPKKGNICAIFLSQSGETKDLYRCIKICKDNNIFTIGVINVIDSLIAREVDCNCYLNAGREVGVASTKAFTNQIIVLSIIAIYFAQINDLNSLKREYYINSLINLPSDIKKTLEMSIDESKNIAFYLKTQQNLFILGKGSLLSCAIEGALKIKEIGYIHAEAYGGNALRHGPYAIIENGTPIIFISPNDENFILMNNTIEEVKSRNAYPIIITDITETFISRHAKNKLIVSKNTIYNGILHNIPMQLISYYLALFKGNNPDMPKNLSKCVSV